MIVVSKFRKGYIIKQAIGLPLVALFIVLLVSQSFINGKLDFQNLLFWLACLISVGFIYIIVNFIFSELKQLTVSAKGIEIKYLVTKHKDFIEYTSIKKYVIKKTKSMQTSGFYILELHLNNNQIITFSEDQFANFNNIKNLIYIFSRDKN